MAARARPLRGGRLGDRDDGKDLHGSWDADGRLVLFSAMAHRTGGRDAVVVR
ncbi:hypothetical protein OG417_50270 [Actinoallomurus sp. NBC_01490]|uniref:hypothetical protein n=1 Tax=Actinoallomurus sp. NBC_01490 TaxID=2903557 RepID=UPI002E322814|nr:hypothetical protein [Actinoallomurus sp. NBC_01490]